MSLRLTFLGGVETVTGSKYLLETGEQRILVDCGLFQGFKQLRLRNWAPLPVDPKSIDMVVLTHAHLDHTGYLPLLIKHGFAGPVICTEATRDLCAILLSRLPCRRLYGPRPRPTYPRGSLDRRDLVPCRLRASLAR